MMRASESLNARSNRRDSESANARSPFATWESRCAVMRFFTASAIASDTTPTAADSAAARLARHVGFRQAIGDATRLGIVTGYAEVSPGRIALTMGPGFTSASTVEYHLKRIYSAYGDYLNHTLAPVLELHANGAVIGDYTWEGLALSQKVGQGS